MVLTSLKGTPMLEINQATERIVNLAMGKPSTASFTVRADNPAVPFLFQEDTILKVYEERSSGPVIRFRGIVVTVEMSNSEDGTQMSVKVNAADPAWKFSKRLLSRTLHKSKPETLDKGRLAKLFIDLVNVREGGTPTGVKTGTYPYESGSTGTYQEIPFRTLLASINDLANGVDGFDWRIEPVDNETKGYLGEWHAAAVFGTTRETFFDYGWGKKNVRQLGYIRDMTNIANAVWHLPDEAGETEGQEAIFAFDSASVTAREGYEAVAEASGLIDKTLREKWVAENVAVRKNPRKVVSLTLDFDDGSGRVPKIGTAEEGGDYWLGDFVHTRAVIPNTDITLFEGLVRIYQIDVAINDAGRATITPILVDDNEEL